MRNLKMMTAMLAAALTLAACGSGDEEPTPIPAPETVTETAEPYVEPEPEPYVEPETEETFDEELTDLALELTWEESTAEEQAEICSGWVVDPDMMVGFFMEGAGDAFAEEDVYAFFDGKCL